MYIFDNIMLNMNRKELINKIFNSLNITQIDYKLIKSIIEDLDNGLIRVSEKLNGKWQTNEWIKKAILLYF